jgi:hypothetical protein
MYAARRAARSHVEDSVASKIAADRDGLIKDPDRFPL